MPDNLFGTAAGLLEGAGQQQLEEKKVEQVPQSEGVKAGESAAGNISAEKQTAMSGQQAQQLAVLKDKLDQASNMMTITPQVALGMVKNTGDKEWMKAIGQKMRADVVLGMYTHGIKLNQAKKAPKVTQIYDKDGKVRHSVVYTDEDGNEQQLMLDEGMTPDQLNKGKGGKSKSGSGSDDSLKKMKEFNRAYEKARSEISDPSKAAQLQATNPESFKEKSQWLKDNQDQYDANIKALGKGGGAAIPGAAAPAGEGGADNAPFDADAFIKDALGQGNK